jgi:hypothetical protein
MSTMQYTVFDTPVFKLMQRGAALAWLPLALGAALPSAHAQVPEDMARLGLQELRTLVTEGTAVIGDLQPMINSGKVASDQVTPQALLTKLGDRYQKATKVSLDAAATGLPAEVRKAYLDAYRTVVTKHQGLLVKGGQDVFVPAYFRALVLKEFNPSMQGKLQAYATNREAELINGDSAVRRVMKGSPLAAEVAKTMDTGSLEPLVKRSGDIMLGYWPMKLTGGCVSCHAQNGLKQTEGAFGGALVVEVKVK